LLRDIEADLPNNAAYIDLYGPGKRFDLATTIRTQTSDALRFNLIHHSGDPVQIILQASD